MTGWVKGGRPCHPGGESAPAMLLLSSRFRVLLMGAEQVLLIGA